MVGNAFCSSGRILRTKGQNVSPDLCGETKRDFTSEVQRNISSIRGRVMTTCQKGNGGTPVNYATRNYFQFSFTELSQYPKQKGQFYEQFSTKPKTFFAHTFG